MEHYVYFYALLIRGKGVNFFSENFYTWPMEFGLLLPIIHFQWVWNMDYETGVVLICFNKCIVEVALIMYVNNCSIYDV